MNTIRRLFGIAWLLMAPATLYLIVVNALEAFTRADKVVAAAATLAAKASAQAAKTNAVLQWGIIVAIFIPIAVGLVIFGKYALAGEYNTGKQLQNETV